MVANMECVDEIIIDCVRENEFLYDKTNILFKNVNKKKDVWKLISRNLNMNGIEMSGNVNYWISFMNLPGMNVFTPFLISHLQLRQ